MKIETLEISSLAYGGSGIGRLADGRVCFVRGALPKEKVSVKITAEKKRFSTGEIIEILHPSPNRITPDCPLYGQCPGCAYMHCDYQTEIFWKDRQLRDFLVRNNSADESVILDPVPSPARYFYRNKLTLHGCGQEAGYYALDNKTIIPVKRCLLAQEKINALLPQKTDDRILLRATAKDGAMQIGSSLPVILHETIPGAGEFMVDGEGFFQVNLPVAAELLALVIKSVSDDGGKELLELYCGVGVFSIALAEKIPDLYCTGIELNKKAIDFAVKNAALHGTADRCRFFAQDAGKDLAKYRNRRDLILLLDPPRGGIEKNTLTKIMAINAHKIIYISCAADTLARDLKELISCGYRVESSRLLDMFPCTAHFETLTVLTRDFNATE
ncbi:MAG: class I SAM-dependent RNA methyltransferase [Lentisphaeria bacterium]|nr:class I SAM-dependent RNA methyltransferase [Lentisphaeria bacterium]